MSSVQAKRQQEWRDRTREEPTTPLSYARRLASYISDPSTIRVRTLEQFGRSPPIEEIKRLREEALEMQVMKQSMAISAPAFYVRPKKPKPTPLNEVKAVEKIQQYIPPVYPVATAKDVIAMVANHFMLTYQQIVGPDRFKRYAIPRYLCMVLLRERGGSLPQVSRWLGRKDHTTARNAIIKFPIIAQRDIFVRNAYFIMRDRLKMTDKPSILAGDKISIQGGTCA